MHDDPCTTIHGLTIVPEILKEVCVCRALRGGERKGGTSSQEHHSWSADTTTQSAASSAGGADGLPPPKPPLGTPRQPMCDGSNPL